MQGGVRRLQLILPAFSSQAQLTNQEAWEARVGREGLGVCLPVNRVTESNNGKGRF